MAPCPNPQSTTANALRSNRSLIYGLFILLYHGKLFTDTLSIALVTFICLMRTAHRACKRTLNATSEAGSARISSGSQLEETEERRRFDEILFFIAALVQRLSFSLIQCGRRRITSEPSSALRRLQSRFRLYDEGTEPEFNTRTRARVSSSDSNCAFCRASVPATAVIGRRSGLRPAAHARQSGARTYIMAATAVRATSFVRCSE